MSLYPGTPCEYLGRGARRWLARGGVASVSLMSVAVPVLAGGVGAASASGRSSAPASPAGGAVNAIYVGRSAQGFAVRLGRPTAIGRVFTYRATLRCNDSTTFTDGRFSDVVGLNRHGRFQVRFVTDRGATITDVRGSIRGRRASGTISIGEHYAATQDARGDYPLDRHGTVWCQSPVVHWRATAR